MLIRLGAALLVSVFSSTLVIACSCVVPAPSLTNARALAEWHVDRADVIFEGTVAKATIEGWPIKPVAGKTVSAPKLSVTFSLVHMYKGQTSGQLVVETGLGGGDCGFKFDPGKSYLVFAWQEGQQLFTSICSGTGFLADAGAGLRLLRGKAGTSQDLADWKTQERDLPASPAHTHQICGKVSLPKGVKPDAELFVWPTGQEELAAFRGDSANVASDGSYCVGYLEPGKYLIGAVQSADDRPDLRYMSYYPGVAERSKAVALQVGVNGKTIRADFSLLPQHVYQVQGYLRGAPENTSQRILVLLMSTIFDQLNLVDPVELGPHGVFEFEEVPSGHYTVYAALEEDESITFLSSAVEVDVNKNIDGLKLDYVSKK